MDVVKILEKLQELKLVRLHKIVGNYYSVYCPFHKNGQERRPSCGVLLTDEYRNGQNYPEGLWHCFTCGTAKTMEDAVDEILKMNSISSKSGLDWLKENIPGFEPVEFDYLLPRGLVRELNDKYALTYLTTISNKAVNYVSEKELEKYRYTVPYMYERKLNDEVIEKFDIGVDLHYVPGSRVREVPCLTFPVRDSKGNVLFIYRRAIATKNFYMPQGIEKPIYGIYELEDGISSVVICESIINALTCYSYGYNAVALFGTGTTAQLNQLKQTNIKEFVLGLDGDDAGRRGEKKIKNALKNVAIVRSLNVPDGKDINDLSKEEFEDLWKNRL